MTAAELLNSFIDDAYSNHKGILENLGYPTEFLLPSDIVMNTTAYMVVDNTIPIVHVMFESKGLNRYSIELKMNKPLELLLALDAELSRLKRILK